MFFGIQSFVEVFTAILVLWRVAEIDTKNRKISEKQLRREKICTIIIGVCFLFLAAGTISNGIYDLDNLDHPDNAFSGIIITAVATAIMSFLWITKRKIAFVLNSSTIKGDANCSL